MGNIEDLINGLEFDERGEVFEHLVCKICMAEVKADHPDIDPEEYGRLAVGYVYGGRIQVWCLRHKRVVVCQELAPGEPGGPIPI